MSQDPKGKPSAVASVLMWLSCVATPTLHELELDPSRTVGPHLEPKPIETLTMTRASATQAPRRIVSSSSESSADSSLDCTEDMLTPDGDEARAAVESKQVPRYLQERQIATSLDERMDEIRECQDKLLRAWLPPPVTWESQQELPYKPIRSRKGKIKYRGPELTLQLRRSDVLHVEFAAQIDDRLSKVVQRFNSPNRLRAAVLREMSGKGVSDEDYTPGFLWRLQPQPCKPAAEPVSKKSKKAKAAADIAHLWEQCRVGVGGVDIDSSHFTPTEQREDEQSNPYNTLGTSARNVASGTGGSASAKKEWDRHLFLIAEIEGAAQVLGRVGSPARTLLKSNSRDSLQSLGSCNMLFSSLADHLVHASSTIEKRFRAKPP